jgi:hypothetical protein
MVLMEESPGSNVRELDALIPVLYNIPPKHETCKF